jgi:hypothetical protein
VVGIAAVVFLMSGNVFGGTVLFVFGLLLRAAMLAGFVYVGYVLWRENRHQLAYAPSRERSLIYALSILLAVLLVASFFVTGWSFLASIVYLVLIGALSFAIWRLWQEARRYY